MIRVVVCTHNGVRFVEAQLASIMEQTLPVDVVHLFDFASTDGTRELAEHLKARWPKLDVRPVSAAPGVTLSFFHALGQIVPECGDRDVIFLSDQDDVWLAEKTETMMTRLSAERQQGDDRLLLFHDVRICDAALNPIRESHYEGRPFRLPRDMARERLLIANPVIGHTIVATAPMLRLALASLRPSYYVMHDWALTLLAAHVGGLVYVDAVLSLYRQHDANILGAGRKRSLLAYVRRGIALSQAIERQASAFVGDLDVAAAAAGITSAPVPLAGRGPIAWRLAKAFARFGPTPGHRFMAPMLALRSILPTGSARSEIDVVAAGSSI